MIVFMELFAGTKANWRRERQSDEVRPPMEKRKTMGCCLTVRSFVDAVLAFGRSMGYNGEAFFRNLSHGTYGLTNDEAFFRNHSCKIGMSTKLIFVGCLWSIETALYVKKRAVYNLYLSVRSNIRTVYCTWYIYYTWYVPTSGITYHVL